MKHAYHTSWEGILLKPLTEEDALKMRILRNRNAQYFLNQDFITEEMQKQWYERYLQKESEIMFSIVFEEQPDLFLGAVGIYDIDMENKECEEGRFLVDHETTSEKGIGTRALTAVCRFARDELLMEITKAVVRKENGRSLAVHKKVGFEIVGEDEDSYYLHFKLPR